MSRGLLVITALLYGMLHSPFAFADEHPAALVVRNSAGKETKFTAEDLAKLPQKKLEATDPHSRVTGSYEGVLLADLLRAAGGVLDKELKGPLLAQYVLVEARDGYRVVYSIGEIDPGTGNVEVLLAVKKNGNALNAVEGPFRFVLPADKRAARWIRQVSSISVHQLPVTKGPKAVGDANKAK